MAPKREEWGSRFVVIIAAISMAVGAGNIWRFPRVAAEWGGGSFLIALTVALLVWALPLLMAEFLMGQRTQLGNIGAFRDFMGEKFAWVGAWMAIVCIGIAFTYSVITGWTLRYFVYSLGGAIEPGIDGAAFWEAFLANPLETIGFHAVAVIVVFLIIYRGIKGGLESILKVLLPSLFVLVILLAIRAVMLPGSVEGLRYLFVPDWSLLGSGRVWLEAFTQAAWSTGAGWGLLLIYASYTNAKEDVVVNCTIIGFADVLAGFFAAMAVLGTVFALAPSVSLAEEALQAGNVGLTFIYIVELLVDMPGSTVVAPLFFLALFLASISSLIAMTELMTTNIINFGIERKKAAIYAAIALFVFGIPNAISIDFFENQDWVWGVGLLISGLLTAIAMMKYGVENARAQINETSDLNVGVWWSMLIRLIPLMFVAIFGWWVMESIAWYPDTWWHPFEVFSTGTMVFQWLIAFIIVYALNNTFIKHVVPGPMTKTKTVYNDSSSKKETT